MFEFLVKFVNEACVKEIEKKNSIISQLNLDIAEKDKEIGNLRFRMNSANNKIQDLSRRINSDPEKEKLREELRRTIEDCNRLTYDNGRLRNFIEELEERNWRLCDIVEKLNKIRTKRLLNESTAKGSKDNEIKE